MKVTLIDSMGSDLSVVNAARVSFAKESNELNEKDIRLIEYLATHKHDLPFAHTCLSFRVKAPLFVARQLWKSHVSSAGTDSGNYAWNEQSLRYTEPEMEFYLPKVYRLQSKSNKQCSSEETVGEARSTQINATLASSFGRAQGIYEGLIAQGVSKEQARIVLPAAVYTEWIWTGSLLFFARVVKLRLGEGAQEEAGIIAKLISNECEKLFPYSWKNLTKGS
jgi:thymidylate synthase (FAD)